METRLLLTFWKILAVVAAVCAAWCVALWVVGTGTLAVLGMAACAIGLVGVALAAEPGRVWRYLRARRGKEVRLTDPEGASLLPGEIERVVLGELSVVDVAAGELVLVGKTLTFEDAVVALKPDGDREGRWTLEVFTRVGGGTAPSPIAGIWLTTDPAMDHMLFWALWEVCAKRGWGLKAPFGSWRPASSKAELRELVGRQRAWGEDALAEAGPSVGDEVPWLLEASSRRVRYGFPVAGAEVGLEAPGRRQRWLELMAVVSVLGIVTLPLVAAVLWLRHQLFGARRHDVVIEPGFITIDGEREPLEELRLVTLVPVHKGLPMLLTRRRAIQLGGVGDYGERVAVGRHVLATIGEMLDREEAAAATEVEALEVEEGQGPPWELTSWPVATWLAPVALIAGYWFGLEAWADEWRLWLVAPTVEPLLAVDRYTDDVPLHWVCGAVAAGVLVWAAVKRGYGGRAAAMAPIAAAPWVVGGIAAFLLASPPAPGGCVIDGFELAGADLRGARLSGVRCDGPIDLEGVKLEGADLRGAKFEGANLREADLRRARLSRASLSDVKLHKANLAGANLEWASLWRIRGFELDATEADLSGAGLYGAHLHGARFDGAEAAGADFSTADLGKASFRGARLKGANFIQADLRGADLRGALLHGATLRGTDLRGADLTGADLQGADLTDAKVEGAKGLPQ